jgi:hypothetical protein
VGYVSATPCGAKPDRIDRRSWRVCEARMLFNRFHCFDGRDVIREPCRRVIPEVLVHLGRLKGLIYVSDKGERGRPKTYIHFMDSPPRLTSNPEGTQLYIVGGHYRITPRGIEG